MFTKNIVINNLSKENIHKLAKLKVLVVGNCENSKTIITNLLNNNIASIGVFHNDYEIELKKYFDKSDTQHIAKIHSNSENLADILKNYDITVDCYKNFDDKFLLNKLSIEYNKPFVYSFLHGENAQVALIRPKKTACLACMFPQKPVIEDISNNNSVSGAIAALQTDIVFRHALGLDANFEECLLTYNTQDMEFKKIILTQKTDCKECSV